MSLRAVLVIVLALTLSCALAGVIALIVMTARLRGVADSLRDTVDGVRLSEHSQVDLLQYARASDLRLVGPSDSPDARAAIEEAVRTELSGMSRHVATPRERRLLREAFVLTNEYLSARRNAETYTSDPAVVVRETKPSLENALTALSRLTRVKAQQARDAAVEAQHWDDVANKIGVSVAFLLLVLVPETMVWMAYRRT